MSLPIFTKNTLAHNEANMSSSLQSEIIEIGEDAGYAVHSVFTGSPVGTLQVQGSNTRNIADFIPVDAYSITEAGRRLLNVEKAQYAYVLITYVSISGTGSLTSRVSAKRV